LLLVACAILLPGVSAAQSVSALVRDGRLAPASSLAPSRPLRDQPVGVRSLAHRAPTRTPAPTIVAARQPRRWKFVLGGAALGAGVAAVALSMQDWSDAILGEVVAAGTIGASAVLGAGIGWIMYEIRY
jgi:hypothetical protein